MSDEEGATTQHGTCVSHASQQVFERFYKRLGHSIGRRPGVATLLGMLLLFSGLPGLAMLEGDRSILFITLDTNFLDNFAVKGTRYMNDYQAGIAHFPAVRANQLIYSPGRASSALDLTFLRDVLEIENHILNNLTVWWQGQLYDWERLCHRRFAGGPCDIGSVLSVMEHSATVVATMQAAGHTNLSKALLDAEEAAGTSLRGLLSVNMGGMSRTMLQQPYDAWLPTAISSILPLSGDAALRGACLAFEEALVMYVLSPGRPASQAVRISAFTESTLGLEMRTTIVSALQLIVITLLVMNGYAIVFLGTQTRIKGNTQMTLASLASLIPGLAGLSAFGWMAYVGLRLNVTTILAPFLVLAAGLDDAFVLVSAVCKVGEKMKAKSDLPEVMSRALAVAGPAITTTSITSIVAFTVAAFNTANIYGFMVFCACLAVALLLNFLGMIILFPALMVFNEGRILDGKSDLAPMFEGPLRIEKAMHKFDASTALRHAITQYASALSHSRPLQGVGAGVMVGLVVASAYGCTTAGKGMPDVYFVSDSSYALDFYDDVSRHFNNRLRIEMGVLFTGLDLAVPSSVTAARTTVLDKLRQRPDVMEVDCAVDAYAVARVQALTEGSSLSSSGFLKMSNATRGFERHVRPNAIYCAAYVEQPVVAQHRHDQAIALIDLADRATSAQNGTFSVRFYHISFPIHVAPYPAIIPETIATAGWAILSVFCALLLSLSVARALVAATSVACVVVVVVGFMAAASITFNAIVYTTIVMAIGFCVDYTVHVMHFSSLGQPSDSTALKVQRGLEACGYDVFNGAMTAFLGVFLLSFGQSPAFRFFGYISMVIAGVGGMFALFGLPSILLLLTPSGNAPLQNRMPCIVKAVHDRASSEDSAGKD